MMDWAKSELKRIGGEDDEMQQSINRDILEIVAVFEKQGHSGFSAAYALSIIKLLLNWKPITELTGEDDEWIHHGGDEDLYQNNRYSAVFKKGPDNSTAYNIDGKVFSDDGGETWYTCSESFVPVVFPYVVPDKPERIIIGG